MRSIGVQAAITGRYCTLKFDKPLVGEQIELLRTRRDSRHGLRRVEKS